MIVYLIVLAIGAAAGSLATRAYSRVYNLGYTLWSRAYNDFDAAYEHIERFVDHEFAFTEKELKGDSNG